MRDGQSQLYEYWHNVEEARLAVLELTNRLDDKLPRRKRFLSCLTRSSRRFLHLRPSTYFIRDSFGFDSWESQYQTPVQSIASEEVAGKCRHNRPTTWIDSRGTRTILGVSRTEGLTLNHNWQLYIRVVGSRIIYALPFPPPRPSLFRNQLQQQ